MNLKRYLQHRSRYERIIAASVLFLFAATNSITQVIDNLRDGRSVEAVEIWAGELSSVFVIFILLPLLIRYLAFLKLSLANFFWKVLWLLPAFVAFASLHIGLFVGIRTLLWLSVGQVYDFGPVLISLLYEFPKELLSFIGIVVALQAYEFVITRLQGEAKFLSKEQSVSNDGEIKNQFLVKMMNREFLVPVDQIDWIASASNYVLMNCGERSYPMRQTLSGLEQQLDSSRFIRVHRTAIVNLDKVTALKEKGELRLEIGSAKPVPVSKTYLDNLRQALINRKFSIKSLQEA